MDKVRVTLISPLPPPAGGIARWTSIIQRYGGGRDDVALSVINTGLRWRSIHDNSVSARGSAGVPQLLSGTALLLRDLVARSVDVIHINSSGQFGAVRDVVLGALARCFGVPFVCHIRFGRVPELSRCGGFEWRVLSQVFRLA